jgi:hypothetical protein
LTVPPADLTDTFALADWLELTAFDSADRNSSLGDLESLVSQSEAYSNEDVDAIVTDVFTEIDCRSVAAGDGYPFEKQRSALIWKSNDIWQSNSAYIFCLALSYFRGAGKRSAGVRPERVFEDLCTQVAGLFIGNGAGGGAVRFGAPRTSDEIATGFRKAVDALCASHVLEGVGFRVGQKAGATKDYGLDVVAWRHENDRLPGKLLMFGACAAGQDWQNKVQELQPATWCAQWLHEPLVSQVIKSFFVPHRIARTDWERWSRSAGLIFDRCRIARWSPRLAAGRVESEGRAWTATALPGIIDAK